MEPVPHASCALHGTVFIIRQNSTQHDDVIKWKHYPRYWPFVRGIHRSSVNSPHKGQWLGALMFSVICAWINGWENNHEAGDLRRHRAHYDVTVMECCRMGRTTTNVYFDSQRYSMHRLWLLLKTVYFITGQVGLGSTDYAIPHSVNIYSYVYILFWSQITT